MRILHIGKYYPPRIGGTEMYTKELVRHQSGNASVTVIVSNDHNKTLRERRDNANLIRVLRLGVVASMPVTPTLPLEIKRVPADIVHIHMPNPAAALSYLLSGHTGKLILTHHADTVGRKLLRRVSDPIVKATMRRASRIIVTTKSYLDTSAELAPFYNQCSVIPLGIDPGRFIDIAEEDVKVITDRYGTRLLTCVGRLVEFKGFEYAIRALPGVDAQLLIAGRGKCEQSLRELAAQLGVADRVHFLGAVPNDKVPALLRASSVLLFPSIGRTESFGYSQLEAMAAGTPVINTSIRSGAAEISVDGKTGFTVPPGDPAAIAAAARLLLDNEQLRTQFGEAGRRRVRNHYTLHRMAEQTFELYDEVLQSKECDGIARLCRRPSCGRCSAALFCADRVGTFDVPN